MTTRILFIEDDANLGLLLKENLDNRGFDMHWFKDGVEGVAALRAGCYDICILDVMLPVKDGFEVAQEIRTGSDIPIIFLTARTMHEDRIRGLELGGDDYMTKPFSTQELYLRILAILRRMHNGSSLPGEKALRVGRCTFDHNKMTLQCGAGTRRLSSKEADLLHILFRKKDELVTRTEILNEVWGNDDYFSSKSMDVYMSKIRKLLKDDPSIEILNAYGTGFKLIVNEG